MLQCQKNNNLTTSREEFLKQNKITIFILLFQKHLANLITNVNYHKKNIQLQYRNI